MHILTEILTGGLNVCCEHHVTAYVVASGILFKWVWRYTGSSKFGTTNALYL